MWRAPILLSVWLTLVSASPPQLDLPEAGRVLAELNDWRAIIFVLVIMVFMLLGANLWMAGKLVKAVESMAGVREAIQRLSDIVTSAGEIAQKNAAALLDMQHHSDDTAKHMERIERALDHRLPGPRQE